MAAPDTSGAAVAVSGGGPALLCTVSTVKDSRANVERFVERNLASGADHMFVMLEQDDEGLVESLRAHPHVSAVLTDDTYWHGERPSGLNVRQAANADLVNTLLSVFPSVAWLVHLDSDECLDLERDRLTELPEDARCFRLEPLEALSKEHWEGEVDRFKRRLDLPDLSLLAALGAIEAPTNASYFRGHLVGKVGARPGVDLSFRVHHVRNRDGVAFEPVRADHLRVLHYESYSADEFVRKWDAHLSAGPAGFRQSRTLLRAALSALQRNPNLGPDARREYLCRLYKRHIEDPLELLEDLGLLVTPDPDLHSLRPEPFAPEEAGLVEALLGHLARADKSGLEHGDPDAPTHLLEEVRAGLDHEDDALAERIDACLAPSASESGEVEGVG
jgi:hypothetical protein